MHEVRTRYVAVDLVVKGDGLKDSLSAYLGSLDYFVQKLDWNDENKWYLNISGPFDFVNPDLCIQRYCDDLQALPDDAKAEWDQARFREFFIGYHVGEQPPCFTNHLAAPTVARATALNAGIGIALYPNPNPDPDDTGDDA